MGHFCRMCGRSRANEKFSGKGHRAHICRSNISERNLARLSALIASETPEIAALARVVLEVGKVKPHKRKRLSFLARNHRDLIHKLEETGLIEACLWF